MTSPRPYDPDRVAELYGGAASPLLERYPALSGRLPWLPLGAGPTPVEEWPAPGPPGTRLFVKRDDLTSGVYGGNKARKLEFLLAHAELRGRDRLVTLGALGSNHGLATAIHGRRRGFDVDLCLFPQPVTDHVRQNVLADHAVGARVHLRRTSAGALWAARRLVAHGRAAGESPELVAAGGSTPLGTLGYVAAALELAAQVAAGKLPAPDRVFVAAGTCGTAAGLVAGFKLAGLPTRVVAVRVLDAYLTNKLALRTLARRALEQLRSLGADVPPLAIGLRDFDMARHFFGGYGVVTAAGEAAREWAAPKLRLEPTYTAKALAACLHECRRADGERVFLYWHTANSAPLPFAEPHRLAPELRSLLEYA